jgi:hypothetical protein
MSAQSKAFSINAYSPFGFFHPVFSEKYPAIIAQVNEQKAGPLCSSSTSTI